MSVRKRRRPSATRTGLALSVCLIVGCLVPQVPAAQGLTGSLVGRVTDEQGALIQGATVRLSSPALMGGATTLITNEKGQFRFPVLPPGLYSLEIDCFRCIDCKQMWHVSKGKDEPASQSLLGQHESMAGG